MPMSIPPSQQVARQRPCKRAGSEFETAKPRCFCPLPLQGWRWIPSPFRPVRECSARRAVRRCGQADRARVGCFYRLMEDSGGTAFRRVYALGIVDGLCRQSGPAKRRRGGWLGSHGLSWDRVSGEMMSRRHRTHFVGRRMLVVTVVMLFQITARMVSCKDLLCRKQILSLCEKILLHRGVKWGF